MKPNYAWIVFKKEIIDIIRDKKTMFTSILIPLLVFPIIALALGSGMSDLIEEQSQPVPVAITGNTDNEFYKYLSENKNLEVLKLEDNMEALNKLDIYAIIEIPNEFTANVDSSQLANLKVSYDQTSQKSMGGLSRIESIVNEYSDEIVNTRLKELGVEKEILEVVDIETVEVGKEKGGFGLMMLGMMIPMLLVIWSATSCIAPATDLGAGEKERQTLEPLLTTNATRSSIVLGKYFAVVVAGMMATVASIIGFLIATLMNPTLFGSLSVSGLSFIVMAVAAIGLTMTFAAIELAVSFYARNFKEAQTYLAPITMIVLVPAYLTMYVDAKLVPSWHFHVPIMNTIAIIKEAVVSNFNPMHLLIVFAWTGVYILLSVLFVLNLFRSEKVIFRN